MSDKLQHIDIDDEEFEDAPRGLREYAKKLKAAYDSSVAELGKAQKSLASRAVADVLSDKGFKNPKRVERDLLADDIDPHDATAVTAWLEANEDDYARGAGEPAPETVAAVDPRAAEFDRLNVGGDDGSTSPALASKWEAALAEITPQMNGEQVIEVYKRHGI